MSDKPLPLEGIRVLDVSQVMAGPFCCMLLGDLGADVIKVEPPSGDQTRSAMGFRLKGDDSLGFLNMNRNKRSIALDLKSDEDRRIFLELAKTADVIVENYRPGVVKRLGIDYDTVAAINPGIIYASISGFGQTGPWSQRPGFDLMAQAASGIMSITGHPDGPFGAGPSSIVNSRERARCRPGLLGFGVLHPGRRRAGPRDVRPPGLVHRIG